ncbi:hypothetical protein COBT_002873, partial [Conglomerata obtusa]
ENNIIVKQSMEYDYALLTFENLDDVDAETKSRVCELLFQTYYHDSEFKLYAQFDSISINDMYLTECEYFAKFFCQFNTALDSDDDFNKNMKTEKPDSESMIYFFKIGERDNLTNLLRESHVNKYIVFAEEFDPGCIDNDTFKILQTAYLHLSNYSNVLILAAIKGTN